MHERIVAVRHSQNSVDITHSGRGNTVAGVPIVVRLGVVSGSTLESCSISFKVNGVEVQPFSEVTDGKITWTYTPTEVGLEFEFEARAHHPSFTDEVNTVGFAWSDDDEDSLQVDQVTLRYTLIGDVSPVAVAAWGCDTDMTVYGTNDLYACAHQEDIDAEEDGEDAIYTFVYQTDGHEAGTMVILGVVNPWV